MRQSKGEIDRDLGTELEDEMLASGRGHVMPREGLVGAHEQRREGLGRGPEDRHIGPFGRGATVAPSATAVAREAERHQQQRHLGVAPASTQDNLRQVRGPSSTRGQLDGAALEADNHTIEAQIHEEQKAFETQIHDGRVPDGHGGGARRAAWLRAHRGTLLIVGCGLLLAAAGLTTARYASR